MRKYRIFIIDDHPLMRAGMAKVIGMEGDLELVGELGQGRGAVESVREAKPDVILLDLSLKDSSGLELIKDLRAAEIIAAILIISMHDEVLYTERVLRAGGNGYLMKDEAADRVIEGIRTLLSGEIFISEKMQRMMLNSMVGNTIADKESNSLSALTDREFEVFELIGKGKPPRVIAENLGISPKTVDAHRAHIKDKLGFNTGSELLRYAVRWVEMGAEERV